MRLRRGFTLSWVAGLLLAAACGRDAADREYFAALAGEENGSTREQQIAHLDRAISLAPKRATYWSLRATYRIDLRDFAGALSDLDRAIELADQPYFRYLRGLVHCQMGRPQESLADFDSAIAAQPENTQFYRGRGLARAALGDGDGALADAAILVARDPVWAPSFYVRGQALVRLGRDDEARRDFEQAAQMAPELVYPVEALIELSTRRADAASLAVWSQELDRRRRDRSGCAMCLDPYRY